MENTLRALDLILPFVVVGFGISLIIFMFITSVYSIVFYQKKANLKKSKELIAENRQIVEDANFFSSNKKYQAIIDDQLNMVKTLSAKVKSLEAKADDLEEANGRQVKKTGKKGSKKETSSNEESASVPIKEPLTESKKETVKKSN